MHHFTPYPWTIYLIKISLILLSMINFSFHFSKQHTIGTGHCPENIKLNRGQLKIQNRWASSCLNLANCLEVFEGLPRGCKKNGTQEKEQNNIHLLLLTAWCKLHSIKDFKQLKIDRLKLNEKLNQFYMTDRALVLLPVIWYSLIIVL